MSKYVCLLFILCLCRLAAQKPELVIQHEGHVSAVQHVCFSADEQQALSAGKDNRMVLWDLTSKKAVRFIQLDTTPVFICYGSNDQTAIALLAGKGLSAWNLNNGQQLWRVQVGQYQSVEQRKDSLYLHHLDKTSSCWDLKTGKKFWQKSLRVQKTPPPDLPPGLKAKLDSLNKEFSYKITFSRDGRLAVVAIGKPSEIWMTTPGQAPGILGYGGLLVWDLQKDEQPFPVVDLPLIINAVAISADGKRCLSASDDRTVRYWDLSTGKELIRMQREPGRETRITFTSDFRRVAISRFDDQLKIFDIASRSNLVSHPSILAANTIQFNAKDSELIVAGREGPFLQLSAETLNTIQKIERHPYMDVVHSLCISPDGKHLLLGSANNSRVFDYSSGSILKKDIIRLIQNEQKEIIGFETRGEKIYVARFIDDFSQANENDKLVYLQNPNAVSIWNLQEGRLEQMLQPYSSKRAITSMVTTFSPNGSFALAKIQKKWMAWDTQTGNLIRNTSGSEFFNAIHFDDQGSHALSILPDGHLNIWNLEKGEIEKNFNGLGQALAAAFNSSGEKGIILEENGTIREWNANSGAPLRQIKATKTQDVLELRYTPDENFVLVISQNATEIWNLTTGKLILRLSQREKVAFDSDVFWDGHTYDQVNSFEFLPDGKTAVSTTYGGIIQFWDFRSGKEICTLHFLGQKDWAITTPVGLFDASDGAMEEMYFRLGTEVIEIEQLKERYFEPGLLQKLLGFTSGDLRPVDELNQLALHPKITKTTIAGDRVKVQLQVRNGGIGKVALLLNGKIELESNVNPGYKSSFEVDLSRFDQFFLPGTANRLSLRVYNMEGWLKGQPYVFLYDPVSAKGTSTNSPLVPLQTKTDAKLDSINLYALVIGTSKYRGEKLNLKYPDKDAIAFAQALRLTGAPLFGKNMEIKLLTTQNGPAPRKAVVAKAFAEIAAKSDPNDILLVYLSGHGITYPANSEKGQFYYLTTDILGDKLDDPAILRTQAIAQDTLQAWIRKVKALKRILILDACNSGQVVQNLQTGEKALNSDQRRALERMNDRSGMFVLAGSAADKSSYEATRFGHGLLTYSLLNNMPFVAASNNTFIDVAKLFSNAIEEVPRLALDIGKVQKPELIATESFDIGIIDSKVPFVIPQTLPVFVRTVFMESQQNKDVQRLSKAVNTYLYQLASTSQPNLVYLDVEEFTSEHFYLGGQYQVSGNTLSGNATLYQKDKVLATFPFSGPKDQLKTLVDQITSKAFESIRNR